MEKFLRLFGNLVRFSYHCFDRVVINGYLSALARPGNLAYFFREVKQEPVITKELLRERTDRYVGWVEAHAKRQAIPIDWAPDEVRKKDALAQLRRRKQRQGFAGVYAILRSMEQGPSFRIQKPKYAPSNDPNWRPVKKQYSRYKHLYFYILDDVLGPFSMRVGTFLPFQTTYWINGHELLARALDAQGIGYRMRENAFVSIDDPLALQTAADAICPETIQKRLDDWTFKLGPKFSRPERQHFDLWRHYFLGQVEYAHNVVFKRSAPLHAIFERSCDLGLARLTPKYLADIFGWRLTKRSKGKLQTVLDQLDFGHHVLRAYGRNTFFKQYQKFANFLRDETCSNNVTDFKDLRKALEHLPRVASTLQQVNDRFMDQQAELLNVEPDHPLLEQLAQPARIKTQRFGGIRIEQDRIIRLLEVLMDGSTQINGSSAAQLHHALLKAYQLDENAYSRNQLSYDLRKLRAHGLLERIQGRFAYRLTEKGRKTAALLVLLRNRIVRPLAGSLFERPVNETFRPASKLQARYRETKKALNALMDSLKVA